MGVNPDIEGSVSLPSPVYEVVPVPVAVTAFAGGNEVLGKATAVVRLP